MGEAKPHRPVLRVLIAFSHDTQALEWAWQRAEATWGPVALRSECFTFDETSYYQSDMGDHLKKQLVAFEQLMDPTELVDDKRMTNDWEEEFQQASAKTHERELNLDPGYLSEAKLVLGTTKDRDHRLYLGQGIYAEVTLHYHGRRWCDRPWTYPDFSGGKYFAFLDQGRQFLRQKRRT